MIEIPTQLSNMGTRNVLRDQFDGIMSHFMSYKRNSNAADLALTLLFRKVCLIINQFHYELHFIYCNYYCSRHPRPTSHLQMACHISYMRLNVEPIDDCFLLCLVFILDQIEQIHA